MAQGSSKLSKPPKSSGALKKKVVRTKTVTKGRKDYKTKHTNNNNNAAVIDNVTTTKAINRKNEIHVAAKAVSVGTQFFCKDIATLGQRECTQKLQQRDKKELKSSTNSTSSNRLKEQLRKLGRDV
jgi:hypothetical protein